MKTEVSAVKGWQTKQLGDVIKDIGDGGTPNTNKKAYFGGPIPWVVIQDIRKNISSTQVTLTTLGLESCSARLWPAGSIILSTGATIGEVGLAEIPVATKQGIHGIVCKKELSNHYLYYILQALRNYLNANAQGSTIKEVRAKFLRTINIPFPSSLSEQTKIVEILSTVDRAIEQTEALIAKQQRIKTGLMQDLLTHGIDEQGNIRSEQTHRFKDSPLGRIPEEWEVKKVYETGSVTLGRQLAPKYMVGKSPTPYLRVANVFDGWIDFHDILEMDFTPQEREKFFLRSGDILLNEGQSIELVGRSAIFSGPDNVFCFQNTLIRYRAFEETLPTYARTVFKRWLDNGTFQDVSRQTTSVAHLGADRFAQMLFPCPSIDEQKRIMALILAHESQMNEQEKYQSKLKSLKTAIMQDLLTGEKRVSVLLGNREITSRVSEV